jgi:hypothetical protein
MNSTSHESELQDQNGSRQRATDAVRARMYAKHHQGLGHHATAWHRAGPHHAWRLGAALVNAHGQRGARDGNGAGPRGLAVTWAGITVLR